MRRLLPALVLACASLGGVGCSEYHYYDVSVKFDTSTGQFAGSTEISTIQVMVMGVSGADTGSIQIGPNANGLPANSSTFGVFEYSTFVDSGQLTFSVRAYDDATSNPECQTGQGMTTVDASSMITNTAMVTVGKTAVGCVP
jgi:hypothetical protein